jgi:hypothetical protein
MLMTLISMLGGGLMRLLPELFSFLNKKTDNAHELAMLDRQFALEQSRAASHLQEVQVQGDINEAIAALAAQQAALTGQMQKVGIGWVDALNFLVRPLTTFYFLGCYGIYKTAMLVAAFQQASMWSAIMQSYDADDRAILFAIIAFWFVGRAVEKKGALK